MIIAMNWYLIVDLICISLMIITVKHFFIYLLAIWASLVAQLVKNLPSAGDLGLIPGLGRSPGEGKGYPLQYSGLENSLDCIVHRVTKSGTWLNDFRFPSLHWPSIWFFLLISSEIRWLTHSVQFSSVAQSYPTLWDPMNRSTPGLPVHHQLPESTQTHVHQVGDAIQPFYPLSSPFLLPSNFPSVRVFSNESALHMRWPKYWTFSFNISPSNEYSGLISFRMDWLDLLAVQGTLKSLLQ